MPWRTVGLVGGKRRRRELGSGKPKNRTVGGGRPARKERRRAARDTPDGSDRKSRRRAARTMRGARKELVVSGRVRLRSREGIRRPENRPGRTRRASPTTHHQDCEQAAGVSADEVIAQVPDRQEVDAPQGGAAYTPGCTFVQVGRRSVLHRVRDADSTWCGLRADLAALTAGCYGAPPAGHPLCRTCQGRAARGSAA